MDLKGSFTIKAPRQAVWDFMIDPLAIGGCAPGVGLIDVVIPDKKFQATVSAGFGGAFATFKTEVEFIELIAPTTARFRAHGVAPNGAVDATSEMTLVDAPDGATEVKWVADVVVVGALASLAARLMDTITRRLTAEFFACMQRQINLRMVAAASPVAAEVSSASAAAPVPSGTSQVASPATSASGAGLVSSEPDKTASETKPDPASSEPNKAVSESKPGPVSSEPDKTASEPKPE
jgi:uncharacterized protein